MEMKIWKKLLIILISFGLWLLLVPWIMGWAGDHGLLATIQSQKISILVRYREFLQGFHEPVTLLMVFTPWLLFAVFLLWKRLKPVTPIMERAVNHGKLDEISMLIEKGQDINAPAARGQTALHLAVLRDDVDMVSLLLENGADFDVEDGQTMMGPLLTAAERGQQDIVDLLIRFGADINATNPAGDTPLHLAAAAGNVSAVEVLLKYRPDVDARNDAGMTAMRLAEQRGHERVAAVIRHSISQQWPYLQHSNG